MPSCKWFKWTICNPTKCHRVQQNVVVEAELEPNGERKAKRITKVYKEHEEWSFSSTLKGWKMKESNNCYIYIYKVDDKAFLFEIINDYYFYTILLEAIVGKERAPKT